MKRLIARLPVSCMRAIYVTILLSSIFATKTQAIDWQYSGHSKYQLVYNTYPEKSILRDYLGANTDNHNLNIRLITSLRHNNWDFKADYQLSGIYRNTRQTAPPIVDSLLFSSTVSDDDQRLWDLTHTIKEHEKYTLSHRLDRFNLGFTTESTVIRIGRQAVSWGNGLVYTPMDIFNPFDPTAIDREYKTGDDMLYGQYLQSNGHDLQLVYVARRDTLDHEIESDAASTAIKYHGFINNNEYDVLLARHYNDHIAGVGGATNLSEAVWRFDITTSFLDDDSVQDDTTTSFVTSISYSWVAWQTNFNGHLEYFHNGFGLNDNKYNEILADNALFSRLERGELYTIGKHYLAASATIELTPLLLFSPGVFLNLDDKSSLVQLSANYDWLQNLQLLTAITIPSGNSGSEYGGIETNIDNKLLSTGPGLFLQLAWYF